MNYCFFVCTDDTTKRMKCHTQKILFPTQLPLEGCSYSAAACKSSAVQWKKDPQHSQHHPTSLSSDTCRYLSPTTGPLPTVHCWQSTMHCPNSAKWGKSLFVVYMYTWDQGGGGGLSSQVWCHFSCKPIRLDNWTAYFLKPSEVESKEEATSIMFFSTWTWSETTDERTFLQRGVGVSQTLGFPVCVLFFFLEGVHCWISTMALVSLVVWYLFHSLC